MRNLEDALTEFLKTATASENERLQAELDALTAENKRLRAELAASTAENERLQAELDALTSENERLRAATENEPRNDESPEKKAFLEYKIAAERGDATAMHNLGYCYYNGVGVERNYAEAVGWYRKAVELGNAMAMGNLGVCYHTGKGVEQNYAEAVGWYRKAAELGNLASAVWLAEYDEGDSQTRFRWRKKAAELGDVSSMSTLGSCYYNGQGVDQNYAEAVGWYRKAAELGDATAMNNFGRLLQIQYWRRAK